MKEYKIKWIVNAVKYGKRGPYISLGFCEKNRKVAFVSVYRPRGPVTMEFLKIFGVNNVYVGKKCEDATYCWDLNCKLNKSNQFTLKKYVGKCDNLSFRRVSDTIQKWGEEFLEHLDWNSDDYIFFEKPPLRITIAKRSK